MATKYKIKKEKIEWKAKNDLFLNFIMRQHKLGKEIILLPVEFLPHVIMASANFDPSNPTFTGKKLEIY